MPAETLEELTATELDDTGTLDELGVIEDELGATDDELAGIELELGAMLEELTTTITEELETTGAELEAGGTELELGATEELDAGAIDDKATGLDETATELEVSTAGSEELLPPGVAATQAPRLKAITAADANLAAEIKEVILKAPPEKNWGL